MRRLLVPVITFLVLLILLNPFFFDFTTSFVPGWHTTIALPYFNWGFILIVLFQFLTIGYWHIVKRVDKINWTLFSVHFLLIIPAVIFLKYPSIFLDVQNSSQEEIIKAISIRIKLIPVAWTLFIVGQILFIMYLVRTNKTKQVAK